jgi:hypothetical protein
MSEYESLYHWRLCDELSITQASLLYAGIDPSSETAGLECWKIHERPDGYEAAKSAILNALRRGAIVGTVQPNVERDFNGNEFPIDGSISLDSIVDVESLKFWLKSRGVHSGFFFPVEISEPDYLNKDHPRYSDQLAACVKVWIAFEDENLLGAKSPKNAMDEWLNSRYYELGLVHQGKISKTAIEECAKVANWKDKGGATATPTSQPTPP